MTTATKDTKITLEEAIESDAKAEKAKRAKTAKEDITDTIDKIEPQVEPRKVIITDGQESREYIQRPLTFFKKIEWFSLLGKSIDVAMQTGLTVNTMLEASPGLTGTTDLDSFVLSLAKIANYAPDLFKESYCIWLN